MAKQGTEVARGYLSIIPKFATSIKAALAAQTSQAGPSFNWGMRTLAVTAGRIFSNAIQSSIGSVGEIISEAIAQADALKRFPLIMSNLGQDSLAASQAIHELRNEIAKTPTDFTKATQYMTRFVETTKDLDYSKRLILALNNAIIAGGAATQVQEAAWEQFTQALAKNKPDRIEVKSLLMAMPAQVSMVAKKLGLLSSAELMAAMTGKNATITMKQFADALIDVNENGIEGFASLAEQAKSATIGIDMAFQILHNRIVAALASSFEELDYSKTLGEITAVGDAFAEIIQKMTPLIQSIGNAFLAGLGKIVQYKDSAISYLDELYQYIQTHKEQIKLALKDTWGFAVSTIKTIINVIGGAVTAVTGFIDALRDIKNSTAILKDIPLTKVLGAIVGTYIAIGLLKKAVLGIISPARNAWKTFDTFFGHLFRKSSVVTDSAEKIKEAAKGTDSAGNTMKNAGKKAQSAAKGFSTLAGEALKIVAIGGGIALAGVGLKQLADGAAEIAQNGWGAAGAMLEMAAAMAGMFFVVKYATKGLEASAPQLIALGAALLLAGTGMRVMADGATQLAQAGTPAMIAFGLMAGAIAGIAAVMGAVGDKLTKAAPGMLALGASMLLVSAAAKNIADALTELNGVSAESVLALTIFSGVMMGLIIIAGAVAGDSVAVALGMLAVGAAVLMVGAGVSLATNGLAALVNAFANLCSVLGVTVDKTEEQKGMFEQLQETGSQLLGMVGDVAEGLGGMVAGLGDALHGLGLEALAFGMQGVADAMERINGVGGDISGTLENVRSECDGVGGAMENMKNTVVNAFNSMADGARQGKDNVVQAVKEMINEVNNAFNNVGDSAYWAGVHIAEQFAAGIRSKIEDIKSAVGELTDAGQPKNEVFGDNVFGNNTREGTSNGLLSASIGQNMYNLGRSMIPTPVIAGVQPTGDTYNVWINDNTYNDDPEITRCVKTIMRKEKIIKGMG